MVTLAGEKRLTRRRTVLASIPATALGAVLGAGCTPGGSAPPQKPADLSGTFDLMIQNFGPTISMIEQTIAAFKAVAPRAQVTYAAVGFGEMATNARTYAAAGSGPAGIQTYNSFWRGIDAATIFMPLTPQLMRRHEIEQVAAPHLLDTMWSKKREVFLIPQAVGVNGSHFQYNAALLGNAGIDPKRLTTLDAIVEAATKLVVREGQEITRAGLLPTEATACIHNWIIDQGGKFYDEKTQKWTWQTVEAERAMRWLLDLYDKHQVAWRTAPAGSRSPMGEGRSAAQLVGAYSLSGLWQSHPDTQILDQPLPAFVAGRQPNYYLNEISGTSLGGYLKPDDAAARIGAAFYTFLYAAENRIKVQANEYSGAILNPQVYADPRFKETRFGPQRTEFAEKVIKRTTMLLPAATPGIGDQWTKVVKGELSISAALAEAQHLHQNAEEEALRSRG
jgi:ABC-type glycerol-3-phosphate transport system substrate-binding protein